MSVTLRIILIIGSIASLMLCFKKVEQSKLKVNDSIGWIIGSMILIFMSVFSEVVEWISSKLGFMAPVNCVFFVFIVYLICQVFRYNLKLSEANEKLKNIDHYIALKEQMEDKEKK